MNYQRPPFSAGAHTNSTPTNSSSSNSTNQTTYDNILTPKHSVKPAIKVEKPSNYINNNQFEYFTNNQFSRSFNSLILDDIKDDIQTSNSVSSKMKINKSPPFNVKQDYYEENIDDLVEDMEDDAEDGYELTEHQSPTLTIIRPKKLFSPKTEEWEEETEKLTNNSQQSSIKRSSKFLNLSIDSNLKTLNNKVNEDIDYISDLNEIDSSILKNSKENTPIDNSSPILSKTPFHNKFKRPHKLVSQSPSPSSNKVNASKSFLYQYNKSPQQNNLYSPSKLGLKGFKMFKNADKDAIISPNRSTPERPKTSKLFEKNRLSTNKFRKTNLNNSKSPFNKQNSSPVSVNFEYYNLDDIDLDSPSKNRKLSNSSNNSIIIYQDNEEITKKNKKIKNRNIEFDDKENKSYKFVKPLQTAFKSSGLLKKGSINNELRKLPPETPIKKNPLVLISTNNTPLIHTTTSNDKHNNIGNNNHYNMINANKTSLSNIKSSAHEEFDDNSEISIEVGRNNLSDNSALNDSTSSFFKIPSTNNSQRTTNLNLFNTDLDIDLSSDLDISVPETPTKSVKKSHSIPANFSPVHFKRIDTKFSKLKHTYNEPSTPTNLLFKSNESNSSVIDKEPSKIDDHLINKFGMRNIKYIGSGEFSIAYECVFQSQKFAIKRSKKPIIGKSEKKAIMREIEALRVLTSVKDNEKLDLQEQEEGKEYLVYFIEAWDFNNYYYIMTEFCDNGTLFDFLEENKNYKIDEFRIWKILIEILNGLKFIHSKNYLHLDLKPANIFITFEGSLKIGDFGLATKLPILEKDFDLEGDRNYIAPELINDKIYTPFADIFSVGLIILEIAANIVLPDNGTPWRKLRSGDLSDAGKLSSDNLSDFLSHQNFSSLTSYNSIDYSNQSLNHNFQFNPSLHLPNSKVSKNSFQELIPSWAPDFLVNGDSMNLDKLVNKMLKPNPFDRPNSKMILEMNECIIIENRRKAGATIFEGEFGPHIDDE